MSAPMSMSVSNRTRRFAGIAATASALALGGAVFAGPAAAQLPEMGTIDNAISAASSDFGDPGSLSPRYLFGPGPGEITCMAITPGCMGLIPYLIATSQS